MTTPQVGLRLIKPLTEKSGQAEFDGTPAPGSILALVDGDKREHIQVYWVDQPLRICGIRRGVGTDSYDWPEGTQVL